MLVEHKRLVHDTDVKYISDDSQEMGVSSPHDDTAADLEQAAVAADQILTRSPDQIPTRSPDHLQQPATADIDFSMMSIGSQLQAETCTLVSAVKFSFCTFNSVLCLKIGFITSI